MEQKRATKRFLKYFIPTLLVLFIIPFGELGRQSGKAEDAFDGGIRCALMLEDKVSDGYPTGFGYEMAERLASHLRDSVEIFLADSGADYLDSLRQGSLDILTVSPDGIPDSDEFLSLSFGDLPVSWVIRADRRRQKAIIKWMNILNGTDEYAHVIARFFHGYNPYRKGMGREAGIISPYDDLIKENARKTGWDWKIFAALVWCESRFRIQAVSPKGALGLMQLMPRTASRYEVENLLDPAENIGAGAAYIVRLQNQFRDTAADEDELLKFTLAAYNAGEGRIKDCVELARSQGIGTGTWESLCSVPRRTSRDSLLSGVPAKGGKFVSAETVAYVKAVLNQYDIFKGRTPRYKIQPTDTALAVIEREAGVVQDLLLGPDSLGRIDLGDEQARDQEKEHDDQPGDHIGGKHRR